MIRYVFLEDLAYCSATGDIVGFVDFGDAELASLTAANDSVVTRCIYEGDSVSSLRISLLHCINVSQGEIF